MSNYDRSVERITSLILKTLVERQKKAISLSLCLLFVTGPVFANQGTDQMPTPPNTATQEASDALSHYSPTGFSVEYELESDSFAIGGSGKRVLKHLGDNQYRMELTAKSIFITNREISQFQLEGCHITPKHYRYERTGIGKDKRYLLNFAADLNSVEYEANKTKKILALDHENYLDRLSETLAIQCMLASGKRTMDIPIVDKDNMKNHKFKVIDEEVINTKAGKFKAFKVERIRAPNSSRKTHLWFAPQLNFQLVKMVQIKEGRTFKLTLSKYKL